MPKSKECATRIPEAEERRRTFVLYTVKTRIKEHAIFGSGCLCSYTSELSAESA